MIKKKLKFLLTAFLCTQIGFYAFSPLYALYATNLGLDAQDIGLLWGAYSLASAIMILIFGRYQNNKPKEGFIKVGLLVFITGNLVLLFNPTFHGLLIFMSLGALGAGIFFPAQKTLFAKAQNRGRESEEWAWLDSGNMFAAAIGSSIGGTILGLYDFKALFITMLCFQCAAALLAFAGLKTHITKRR